MDYKEQALPLILCPRLRHLHLGQCQCDCACALDLPSELTATSGAGLWVKQADTLALPLEGGWQAFFNAVGPVGVTALNPVARQVLEAFDSPISPTGVADGLPEMPPTALKEAVERLSQVGLLRPVEIPPLPLPPACTLSAWIHVTQACNLNCPYCYVHKGGESMSAEAGCHTVDRVVAMASRHGYTTLRLKYAGGEPTLNFPVVEAMHSHAIRRAAEAGLQMEEVILSNGVAMTDAMLDFMARVGMKLMVSLDGGPSSHDRLRTRRDGKSTYAAVTAMVERAIERGLRPDISITLTALNLEGVPSAAFFALERDLPFSLNFYRECSSPDNGTVPSPLVPDPVRLVDTVLRVFKAIRGYPTYSVPLTGILDRARLDVPHYYPCSAGRDYVAIDAKGQVSACQMLLEEPWADLVEDDPLAAIRRRGEGVFRPVDERSDCRACRWRTACGGGCPLTRQNKLHDRYCRVYQTLFPELVRLEGSRLVAIHLKPQPTPFAPRPQMHAQNRTSEATPLEIAPLSPLSAADSSLS